MKALTYDWSGPVCATKPIECEGDIEPCNCFSPRRPSSSRCARTTFANVPRSRVRRHRWGWESKGGSAVLARPSRMGPIAQGVGARLPGGAMRHLHVTATGCRRWAQLPATVRPLDGLRTGWLPFAGACDGRGGWWAQPPGHRDRDLSRACDLDWVYIVPPLRRLEPSCTPSLSPHPQANRAQSSKYTLPPRPVQPSPRPAVHPVSRRIYQAAKCESLARTTSAVRLLAEPCLDTGGTR